MIYMFLSNNPSSGDTGFPAFLVFLLFPSILNVLLVFPSFVKNLLVFLVFHKFGTFSISVMRFCFRIRPLRC